MSRADWKRPQNFFTPQGRRRIRLTLCYDGSAFCGWQSQNNQPSVQQVLRDCAVDFTGEKDIEVVGSGRTDSGVHARAQAAHIELPCTCTVPAKAFMPALNALLPYSVRITCSEEAEPSFHARYSTMAREYRYFWSKTFAHDPFFEKFTCIVDEFPDIELLDSYARILRGTHDFSTFTAAGDSSSSRVRDIYEAGFTLETSVYGVPVLRFGICGNAFLYRMIRSLCGTMFQMALKRRSAGDFRAVLESGNRADCGKTAYAGGLCLWRISYDGDEYSWFESASRPEESGCSKGTDERNDV